MTVCCLRHVLKLQVINVPVQECFPQSFFEFVAAAPRVQALAHFDGVADGHVEGALAAASQVLSELTTIVTEVAPCLPPEYQVVALAKNLYHAFLLSPLEALYSQPSALEVGPLLKLVEWLDYYNAEM
jgi:hypothetical protein